MKNAFLLLLLALPGLFCNPESDTLLETDVLVVGGGAGGTTAAIQSARMGIKTILVEETTMLGGMLTAAGVSCTDGNDRLPSGIWEEFRQDLYRHYDTNHLNTGWVSNTNFEPHVADSIFKAWANAEKNLTVYYSCRLQDVLKDGDRVTGARFSRTSGGRTLNISADVVVDGTELGDVMGKGGVPYDLGMDDPEQSGEPEAREKNNIIQDLTWAAILKDYGKDADRTISRPANYDSTRYFCSTSEAPCNDKPYPLNTWKVLEYGKLPRSPGAARDKYMLNWPAHGNDYYLNVVEDDQAARDSGYQLAQLQTLGFIYFLQTQLGMKQIGLADDELDQGMALIPYHREGRRLKGLVRYNIEEVKNPYGFTLYRTGISVGDYPVDHHHGQYPGSVPELVFPKIPAFNIPMGCLVPERADGLIVCEKGISVTNIVNGSTRLQPVVLLTGQAAGVMAALCVQQRCQPRDLDIRMVQGELLDRKVYLMPFSDVSVSDPNWGAVQRIGVTGIIQGSGVSEGWANKMLFRPDSVVRLNQLGDALVGLYRDLAGIQLPSKDATIGDIFAVLHQLRQNHPSLFRGNSKVPPGQPAADVVYWNKVLRLVNFDENRPITRYELAVLLNASLNPFAQTVDWQGTVLSPQKQ